MTTPRQQPRALAMARATGGRATGSAADFFTGLRLLGRGFGLLARAPGLWLFGLVPGIIAGALVLAGFVLLLMFLNDAAALTTWFADDWSPDARGAIRIIASIALVGGSLLLAAMTFTALTLTIGDPFYEAISKRVDDRFGGATELRPGVAWHRTAVRNLVDSVRLLATSVAVSALLFLTGFIPLVGQTVVPVFEVSVGGWFLALEISGIPFNRRGLRLRERRRLLAANRALALGFGVPIFLLFLVPFAAIVVMPPAVAGATLLTRRVLGEEH